MINVISVNVKNFLSYGNGDNTYNFKNGIDLICAKNGAGKSTITLDALLFGFYGKPFRKIKLNNLQNSINQKNLLVKIEFTKDNTEYKVIRGLNPSIFEIYKNSELIDTYANVKDYQKMFEENILETSEKTFRNLIVLGGIGITSGFMDLSQSEKEELISNIIDIKLINRLLEKIKDKDRYFKTLKTEINYKIDFTTNIIKSDIEKLKNLTENKLKNSNTNIETYKDEIKILDDILEKIETLKETLNKTQVLKDNLERKINKDKNNLEIFNNSNFICEKCNHENNTSGYNPQELLNSIQKTQENLDKLILKINSLNVDYKELINTRNDLLTKKSIIDELDTINKQSENISDEFITSLKEDIKIKKNNLDGLKSELKDITQEINKYQEISELLGKNNIKKYIINQQIPVLNKHINSFLQLFFTNYSFYFNENLQDKVFYKNTEQSYNQLSNGQKIRICFSIMFSFLKFLEQKNKVIWNILILDEVLDSALDSQGVESLLEVIKSEFKEKNIILISHNENVKNLEIFNRKVKISRDKFSKIEFTENYTEFKI